MSEQALWTENDYILLTPGPLTTSPRVRMAMLKDWGTWDESYLQLVEDIRKRLVTLAEASSERYTAVLMQGSGTFSVESVISSVIPSHGQLAILVNGAYGVRIAAIARRYNIPIVIREWPDTEPCDPEGLRDILRSYPQVTHVAVVHCETTTGILNPLEQIIQVTREYGKVSIVDAMSSFGGMPIDIEGQGIDFLMSSSNKCIQGVPGFGFVLARKEILAGCTGIARTLSLDLYAQWEEMERYLGKWRYTSPTHVVRAFHEALLELEEEGGPQARESRYRLNQQTLVTGMRALGFRTLLAEAFQSPFITSFLYPPDEFFSFPAFYAALKREGFVIYPGKLSQAETFRIGSIGAITPQTMQQFVDTVARWRERDG
jgi:2-aminoethylphosphonate-pyruvate transaminase